MIRVRKAKDRGHANYGWLNTSHSFSFGSYYDSQYMGFSSLRVINEDIVAPSKGFETHPHKNAEILSYVLSGELEHKDSMGNGSIIKAGQMQLTSAGSGIEHSEFNPSSKNSTHFYQIWILPNKKDTKPSYQQKDFSSKLKNDSLTLIASPDGSEESFTIMQDAKIFLAKIENSINYQIEEGRSLWVQVISGDISLNGSSLIASDGAAVIDEAGLEISSNCPSSQVMIFDLPK